MKQRGRMKSTKIPITVKVDHDKKVLFESLKSIHGKTFTDALAEGIENTLTDIIPVDLIEIEISKKEQEIKKLRDDLIQARSVQVASDIRQSEKQEADEYTEKSRIVKFTANQKQLCFQWGKSNINWQGFMNAYQFDNKEEARAWLRKMLISNNLI